MTWLLFAALTVGCWGVYGLLLHTGVMSMGDAANGRYKAFLMVGLAYFITAVLGPLLLLWFNGATWSFPAKGVWWSLIAGVAGAVGALGVLLAFGAKGNPAVVMSIVFAGAPIVNAITALVLHPPQGGLSALRWPFLLGILMAATGGALVTLYKPGPAPSKAPAAIESAQLDSEAEPT
jgi:hypothetical protein